MLCHSIMEFSNPVKNKPKIDVPYSVWPRGLGLEIGSSPRHSPNHCKYGKKKAANMLMATMSEAGNDVGDDVFKRCVSASGVRASWPTGQAK